MGMTLLLESRPETNFDQSWTNSDGKHFIDVLLLSVEVIEKHLAIDLSPLKKTAGEEPEEEDLEEVSEMAGTSPQEMLTSIREQNDAAWQAPADLEVSLQSLIQGLGAHAKNLPLAQLKSNHPDQSYFDEDHFLSDLQDLLRWTAAARQAGAKQVRMFVV